MNKEQISNNSEQMETGSEQLEKKEEQADTVKKRPNANYNLSHPEPPPDKLYQPGAEENLTFHYSRERRLAKAPQAVRDIYNDTKPFRFNLFKPLIADKPRAMLFGSIIILCVIILFFSNNGLFDSSYVIDGNRIEITGTRFEGATILVLKKTIRSGIAALTSSPYTGAVDIAVSPQANENEEYSVFYHRVFFTLNKTEEYRFAVPFDAPDLLLVLQSEKSNLQFKFKPE